MDKGNLKTYAPQARRDFIEMVISRAAQLGIVEQNGILSVADILVQGEVAIVAGQAFPAAIANLRKSLIERMRTDGFTATVEAIAYSWFNRFAALRYMELHGYLDHGHRVLSSVTPKGMPDILTHGLELAESGALPGINHNEVAELKIAGRDGELYKQLLVAQCNKLSTSMPFLFEKIDDDSELLLPDNLLRTDSVIRKLVEGIAEEDWSHVEIIGWLYQFYISEKKDQVMGKVVKSDDIPAATQLFTPNWIVKYLVQNSIGRIWLQANPSSSLAKQMSFYTATSNQTPQAQAQIDALTHMRIAEDGDVLNPETISVLDPACGSGHILVEAYDLLKAIYLERGYRNRDIPRKILQHNLFGLDIDDRAAQMAGFALTMKARADDRRILDEPLVLNITALRNFHGADLDSVAETVIQAAAQIDGSAPLSEGQLFGGGTPSSLHTSGITSNDVCALIRSLSQSKVVGSLITLPTSVVAKLPVLMNVLHQVIGKGDDLSKSYAEQIYKEFVRPAQILSRTYDVVVANPPYMGSNGMNPTVKDFAKKHFPNTKSDLFAMFMERGFSWCKPSGINSMVTMQSWMFLSSYSALRKMILDKYSILSLMQIGYNSFPEMNSKIAQACAFSIGAAKFSDHSGCYVNLNSAPQSADKEQVFLNRSDDLVFEVDQSEFSKISGIPIAYWASAKLRECFSSLPGLGVVAETKQGLATTNNSLFLRQWYETDFTKIGFSIQDNDAAYKSGKKWFPLNKGGGFRRWYGNHEYTINFEKGGAAICEYIDSTPGVNVKSNGRVINRDSYFKEGLTWSSLTSAGFSMRYSPGGFIFETKGSMCFPNEKADTFELLAIFNSKLVDHFLQCLSPTLDYHEGPIKLVPTKLGSNKEIVENVREAISIAKLDWDSNETSWDFKSLPTVSSEYRQVKLSQSWSTWNRVANSASFES